LREVRDVRDAATRADVLDLVGDARHDNADYRGEERIRREQIRAASASRDSRAIAIAWLALAECIAQDPARTSIASELVEVADAETARHAVSDLFSAQILTFRCQRAKDARDYSTAKAYFLRALELRRRTSGSDGMIHLDDGRRIWISDDGSKSGLDAVQDSAAVPIHVEGATTSEIAGSRSWSLSSARAAETLPGGETPQRARNDGIAAT
jgi:hypothetical protein